MLALTLAACDRSGEGLNVPPEAGACASCHPDQYEAWRGSAHAASGASPVMHALMARSDAAWGSGAADACASCHQPGHGEDDGIGCVSCHAAVGNRGTHDGRLIVDLDAPIAGPLIDPAPTPAHGSRKGGFLASPQLCGTCHEVTGPGLFVEPTYQEFVASGSQKTCADCHMPRREPGPAAIGGPDRPRRSHTWVGLTPRWGASASEQADAAEAARQLMAEALTLDAAAEGDAVRISLTNTGASHMVPTGVAMLRDVRIDVRFLDASGAAIAVRPRVIDLGAGLMRAGQPVALPTDADEVVHRGLAPGETRTKRLDAPAGAATAEVTLRARAYRQELLEALGLDALSEHVPEHVVERSIVRAGW